jgi:hypothetical protein
MSFNGIAIAIGAMVDGRRLSRVENRVLPLGLKRLKIACVIPQKRKASNWTTFELLPARFVPGGA